jgi:signal transduction histidine kinase/CheY-like chemotaxis protein
VIANATAAPTIAEIARVFIEEGVAALEAWMGGLWMTNEADGTLDLLQWAGIAPDPKYERVPLQSDAPIAVAVRTETPVWIDNRADYTVSHPESSERTRSVGEFSCACVPLVVEGRSIGAILFGFPRSREFAAGERTFLVTIASQCANAMELRRLYAAEGAARRQAESARAEAEAANRAKDEFLAMLGHELRNPLAPIVAALSLTKLRANGGELGLEHGIVERQVRHLVRLVDDLLDVSRIARGALQLHRAPVDLADVLTDAVEEVSPLILERRHLLTIDVPTGIVVDADAQRLLQVLANLLTNAAKYTPRRGRIAIVASAEAELVRITVRDNGIGLTPELLSNMFDMFVQGTRRSDRSGGGLGLGLAIVKNLVERHGGKVAAASDGPGCGTELTVWWPLSAERVRASTRAPIPTDDRALRVLVVDDNVDAATTLGELLSALGHRPTVMFDAPSAIASAQAEAPELALVDIGLPRIDGYELARRLRALPGLAVLPIIAITGYGGPCDLDRTRREGFADHLVKPVGLDDLRELFGTASPQRGPRVDDD